MKYPSNQAVAKLVDYLTDRKIQETMPDATKQSAQKIAGYLDFICGYFPDYEKHVVETDITVSDINNAFIAQKLPVPPEPILNKILKQVAKEKSERIKQIELMQAFLKQQQSVMKHYTSEQAAKIEEIQELLEV